MNVTGKTIVFQNEYNGKVFYNTSIGNKQQDGTYENMSLSLQLPQGRVVEHKTYIDIKKGFLSFYTKQDGTKVLKLIVMEFTSEGSNSYQQPQNNAPKPSNEPQQSSNADAFASFGATIDIGDSDLPF